MNLDLSVLWKWLVDLGTPDPARDWIIASSFALVVALAGIGLSAYLFWGTQTGSIVSASADVPRAPISVSREAIKTVLEVYQERAANYMARNFVVVDLVDPRPAVKKK